MRMKLIQSILFNVLIPFGLYMLLRPLFADDIVPLAIAGAVPVVRTVALWLVRRRVDWIGLYATVGWLVAVAVSALSGGNELFLKIHDQLLTGTVGLVLLLSAITDRPLLLPLIQIIKPEIIQRPGNPALHRRTVLVTALLGLLLFGNAAVRVILAITLPTDSFLVLSRAATVGVLGGALALRWWIARRARVHATKPGGDEQ